MGVGVEVVERQSDSVVEVGSSAPPDRREFLDDDSPIGSQRRDYQFLRRQEMDSPKVVDAKSLINHLLEHVNNVSRTFLYGAELAMDGKNPEYDFVKRYQPELGNLKK